MGETPSLVFILGGIMSLKETISKAISPSLRRIGLDIKDLYKKIEDVSKNAFNQLTEEQRQSLKGPKGDQGPQGPPGQQGPAGPAGSGSKLSINQSKGTITIGEQGDSTITLPGIRTFQWVSPEGTMWLKPRSKVKLIRKGNLVFAYLEGPNWGTISLFPPKSAESSKFERITRTIDGTPVSWYRIKLPNGNDGFQGHPIIPYGFRPTSDVSGSVYADSGLVACSIFFGSGANEFCIRMQYEGYDDAALGKHVVSMLRMSSISWITTDNEPTASDSPTNGTITII